MADFRLMESARFTRTADVQAVLFDFGGTLDSNGVHWLDRFYELYAQNQLTVDREAIRGAFDSAEAELARDAAIRTAGLRQMVERHVALQFAALGISDNTCRDNVVRQFIADVCAVAAENAELLAELRQEGLTLGVISNGCGNTSALCDELLFSPHLEVVLDSRQVGLSKPDPQFFRHAADELRLTPERILMVGDSTTRDIEPAKSVGMQTAWVNSDPELAPPAAADFRIHRLGELRHIVGAQRLTK